MEYKIFQFLRTNIEIPFLIRFIFGIFFIITSIIPIILPIFPWSLFVWLIMLVLWILFIVPWKKIKYVIKIRKWITYWIKNYNKKRILNHKIRDIKFHIKKILKN